MKIVFLVLLGAFYALQCNSQELDSIRIANSAKIVELGLFEERIYQFKNTKLPEFHLLDLSGQPIDSKDFLGKPMVINFWFSSCEPCIEELPVLNALAKEFKDRISFLAITFESGSAVQKFLEKRKFQFQHLVDAKQYIRSFGMFGYPKTLVIDSEQNIVEIVKMMPKQEELPQSVQREEFFKAQFETVFNRLLNK